MAVMREIMTRLGFQVDDGKLKLFRTEVAKTKRQMNLAAKTMKDMRRHMNNVAMAAKAMTVAIAGHALVKKLTTDYSGPLDELAKFSAALGMNVEDLQAWVHGAGLSGASAKELQTGIQKLSVNMHEAASGGKEQAEAFRDIGVSVKDSQGNLKSQKQLMMEIADRFAASEDGATKTALAVKVFGKAGAKLIPFLNAGSKGIGEMSAEARRLGIVMSGKQAAQAEAYNDSMARVKAVMTGIRNQIAARLLPVLTAAGERFQEWASSGEVAATVLIVLGNAAKIAAAYLAKMAYTQVKALFAGVVGAAQSATAALLLHLGVLRRNIAAMWTMSATGGKLGNVLRFVGLAGLKAGRMLTLGFGKFMLIATAIAAVVGAIYGVMTGQGGEIGKMAGEDALKSAKAAAMEFWKVLKPLIPYLAKFLVWVINVVLKIATVVLKGIVGAIRAVVNWVSSIVSAIQRWDRETGYLTDTFTALKMIFSDLAAAASYVWRGFMSAFKAAYDWIYPKIKWIVDKVEWLSEQSGGATYRAIDVTTPEERRLQESFRLRNLPSVTTNTSAPVQNVNVGGITVNAAPNMTPAEVQRRVTDAAAEALKQAVRASYFNRAQAVP